MNKFLVATRSDEGVASYTEITHPIIQNYAKSLDADFIILKNIEGWHRHHRIFQLYDLLDKYDRIVVMDSDVLIVKGCPNILEIVKYNKIGTIFEDVGTRKEDRRNRIIKIQNTRGDVGWRDGYINSGVCVFSKIHKDLFKVDDPNNLWLDLGFDDLELAYRINQMQLEIQELPYNLNFMSMFTENPFYMTKSDALILHFAGNGFNQWFSKSEQIRQDYLIMKKCNMVYGE